MNEITFKAVGNETHYSCGCKDKKVGGNYIFLPCSPECEIFLYVCKLAKERKSDISIIDVRDDKR